MSFAVGVALALIGLVGGVGITAVGPGGVLPTIGLFLLTGLSPAQVAGTSLVTNIGTGVLGAAAFARSGELRRPHTRRTAALLAGTAVVGAPLGVAANGLLSHRALGMLLGLLAAAAAVLLLGRLPQRCRASGRGIRARSGKAEVRERSGLRRVPTTRPVGMRGRARRGRFEGHGLVRGRMRRSAPALPGPLPVAVLGLAVAVLSGMVGIGGPMLTVPLLVALGVPLLESLASAQVQSVVVAGVGSLGYLLGGAVDWRLALLVGVPELAGVLVGWRITRVVPEARLTGILVAVLVVLAPYLLLRG